jgi:ribosomal protein L32
MAAQKCANCGRFNEENEWKYQLYESCHIIYQAKVCPSCGYCHESHQVIPERKILKQKIEW